jgi:integrase
VAVAVRRACDRADRRERQAKENAKAEAEGRPAATTPKEAPDVVRLVARWHPHQLRHTHASAVRQRFGLDAARNALGHSGASITEIYAERDVGQAIQVAALVG